MEIKVEDVTAGMKLQFTDEVNPVEVERIGVHDETYVLHFTDGSDYIGYSYSKVQVWEC